MNKKVKIFIVVLVALSVLTSAGVYVNYQFDKFIAILDDRGMDLNQLLGEDPSLDTGESNLGETQDSHQPVTEPLETEPSASGQPLSPGTISELSGAGNPSEDQVIGDIENRLGQPVDKKDLINATLILLRNLNVDEICFLYEVGKKERQTKAELTKARKILTTKLDDEEIEILRDLGAKYNRRLKFLH